MIDALGLEEAFREDVFRRNDKKNIKPHHCCYQCGLSQNLPKKQNKKRMDWIIGRRRVVAVVAIVVKGVESLRNARAVEHVD
jgi:hypothetical protein